MGSLHRNEVLALAVESRLMVTDGRSTFLNDLASESTVIAFAAAIESLVSRRWEAHAPELEECVD